MHDVATRVRAWAEKAAAASYYPDDLEGFCAFGARRLFAELRKAGHDPRLCAAFDPAQESYWHAFVTCEGFVVDVTATQFRQPPVVVLPVAPLMPYYWHARLSYRTDGGFVKRMLAEDWPSDEILFNRLKERIIRPHYRRGGAA